MKTFKTLLIAVFALLFFAPAYGQLKVIADGKVGIATTTPEEALDVNGNAIVRAGSILMGQTAGASDARIEVGYNRASDGNAYFDMIADAAAFPDFGVRLIRFPNGFSRFDHRGDGPLQFLASDNGTILIATANTERMRVSFNGNVGIGSTSPTSLLEVNGTAAKPGGGDWDMISDKRVKKNIRPFTDGLKEVMAINPVVYQYNGKAGIKDTEKEYVGIIAQEIQEVAPYMVETKTYKEIATEGEGATYQEKVKSSEDFLTVNASAIRYMLVNAVQEQQRIIESQASKIEDLEKRLEKLEEALASVTLNGKQNGLNFQTATLEERASLRQNQPNPFNQTTSIQYFVPEGVNKAKIQIFDSNGRLLKELAVAQGNGTVEINAGELNSGLYTYSLIINGSAIDTKQMTLTK